MGDRAQISMEYLLVTAFAFMLLVPIIIIAYSESASFSRDVTASQVQKAGHQIVDAANTVYYAGPPAKKTVKVHFPELINSVTLRNDTVVFSVQGYGNTYEYSIVAAGNMTGAIASSPGLHTITVVATGTGVNITDG